MISILTCGGGDKGSMWGSTIRFDVESLALWGVWGNGWLAGFWLAGWLTAGWLLAGWLAGCCLLATVSSGNPPS